MWVSIPGGMHFFERASPHPTILNVWYNNEGLCQTIAPQKGEESPNTGPEAKTKGAER